MDQAIYTEAINNGCSQKLAEVLASRRMPYFATDDTFIERRRHFSEMYGEDYARRVKKALAKRGVKMTAHDDYEPSLARFVGDPEAVISRTQGRGHVKRVCEKRGWSCDGGGVSVASRELERDPMETAPKLSEDLIRDNIQRTSAEDPDFARLPKQEQREAVIDKHGRQS